jgi:D-glycero-D-manno-heptose 1,7-bisphosphate phosphatase
MREAEILTRYRLVVFDADDTLRETVVPGKPCPHGPGEWVLRPGVRDVLRRISWSEQMGPHLGLASNQDHVAYGFLSLEMARRLLRDLAAAATGSVPADPALQLCPHPADRACECRKPEPGMLLTIMDYYGVEPAETLFVGDAEVDREAAARAGTSFMWASDLFGLAER